MHIKKDIEIFQICFLYFKTCYVFKTYHKMLLFNVNKTFFVAKHSDVSYIPICLFVNPISIQVLLSKYV